MPLDANPPNLLSYTLRTVTGSGIVIWGFRCVRPTSGPMRHQLGEESSWQYAQVPKYKVNVHLILITPPPERNYKPTVIAKSNLAKLKNSTTRQYYNWLRRVEFQLTVPDTLNYGGSGSHPGGGGGSYYEVNITANHARRPALLRLGLIRACRSQEVQKSLFFWRIHVN